VRPALRRRRLSGAVVWVAAAIAAALLGLGAAGCGGAAGAAASTRTIVDMGGRSVKVPQVIDKVLCSNPIGTVDIYMLDPALLAGWNFKPSGPDAAYIPSQYLALPSLGVWMGAGATPNIEEVRSVAPDVILCFWSADATGVKMADTIQKQAGVPVVLVDYDVRSTPKTFAFLGTLLGETERAETLASYCRDKLAAIGQVVASVPQAERPTLFLAEGKGGLQTDPVGSLHVQDTFDLLGIKNVVALPGT
jgi:iron complex transport system substrate-binding protein